MCILGTMKKAYINCLIVAVVTLIVGSCEETYTPKPTGFFRIDLPEHAYQKYEGNCPYTFEYSQAAEVQPKPQNPCWLDIHYPKHGATIHTSYIPVNNNLRQFIEDARELAFKHTVKADDIQQELLINDSANVFGLSYDFEGNTASQFQFYITDSTNHLFRGSLYFNVMPNADSIKPVANYIKQDIQHMVNSFRWKDSE